MKKHIFMALLLTSWMSSLIAHQKHVHGEGNLDVAIEKSTLSIMLTLPLDVLVGFERAPKNDKEKAALALAEKTLRDATALWILPPAANCRIESTQVRLPKFEGGHADINADYVFHCNDPNVLKSIETTLFKAFKRLYRLDVQRIGPTGQGAARLSPNRPRLNW
ncbi:DUF2796 domain-containing protein [Parvibium lacunae]|uniref:DUF2796 domain-containing protein n=1 Tax=Parvibium lacunae TaxID=1888893 RepID=A0A368L3H1_9BURK|nr:DUF2796 domain-containing protein [Parvibium lacunae]RCS58127.1 DUF2796 domain-containing protein [Parvibium lacunae]